MSSIPRFYKKPVFCFFLSELNEGYDCLSQLKRGPWDPNGTRVSLGPHHGPRGIILFQKIILFASPCGYKIKILIKLIQKTTLFLYH